jgi:hypothetical protein
MEGCTGFDVLRLLEEAILHRQLVVYLDGRCQLPDAPSSLLGNQSATDTFHVSIRDP